MNQQVKIPILDQIQNAERRYYVALHQYARAAKSSPPELAEQLRKELCDAFEELRGAHEKLALGCEY
jgi:ribosomal protein S7